MATNEILRFAETDTGTNLLTQSEYAADSQRPIGNQPGVARSKLVNKALRQASLIAAGLAEYIADNQANNITDALTPQNIADYLQAALTGALGVTPPQFDNDTSLATTAFVQRALGNNSNFINYAASQTLTASQVGQYIRFNLSANGTCGLPAPNAVPAGSRLIIQNAASASWQLTISTPSGNISGPGRNGIAGTTLVLTGGVAAQMEFVSDGVSVWYAVNGNFAASLGSNGWQRLPNGLIVQWGSETVTSNAGNATRSFPLTFPNAALFVMTSHNTQDNVYANAQITVVSASQFSIGLTMAAEGLSRPLPWIAIGW